MTYGPQAYDDLLKMEGQIRKQRQETIYKQQQLRRQIGEAITWFDRSRYYWWFCCVGS